MNSYKIDFHVHTNASDDGCSSLDDLVYAAKACGLDAIAVTDHNLCTPCPETLNGVLLIPGCEISTSIGHITALFLEKPISLKALGHLPAPEKAVAAIREAGGIAVLAHPFQRKAVNSASFDFSLDAVEAINARANLKVSDANKKADALAVARNLPKLGGSDAHHKKEVGNAYTQVQCAERTLACFRQAVITGNTVPVSHRGTTHTEKGRSQWIKAFRSRKIYRIFKGTAYWCYCILKDIFQSGSEYQ